MPVVRRTLCVLFRFVFCFVLLALFSVKSAHAGDRPGYMTRDFVPPPGWEQYDDYHFKIVPQSLTVTLYLQPVTAKTVEAAKAVKRTWLDNDHHISVSVDGTIASFEGVLANPERILFYGVVFACGRHPAQQVIAFAKWPIELTAVQKASMQSLLHSVYEHRCKK